MFYDNVIKLYRIKAQMNDFLQQRNEFSVVTIQISCLSCLSQQQSQQNRNYHERGYGNVKQV